MLLFLLFLFFFFLLSFISLSQVEQFEMSPGEKYLVNYSRPDPSDPDPEVSASFLPFFPLFQSDEKLIKLVHLQGLFLM